MNIIGLGHAGCAIAECFSKYSQYKTFYIDHDRTCENSYTVEKQQGPEQYEQNAPDLKKFLDLSPGAVYIVIGGAGDISGMALRVMEAIEDKKSISIVYIQPDRSLLSERKKRHERVTFNVLQQYARSGAISRIYLISNSAVEAVIGDVPIIGYYDKLNEVIVSTLHMINVCKNQEPVLGGLEEPGETRRISTFGIYDFEKDEEKLFFSLDKTRESCYIYCVGNKRLREDGSLHKTIVSQMTGKITDETKTVSYGVFPTSYKTDYGYLLAHSPIIQNQ
jgi:hypothetical protein